MTTEEEQRLRVSVVYNAFEGVSSKENIDYLSEAGVKDEADAVCGALERLGHKFTVLPLKDVTTDIRKITGFKPDVIFNLCEGYLGNTQHEMYVAGLWELLDIPYTGNAAMTLGIAQNKILTKQLMRLHGIPTPDYEVFTEIPHNTDLTYPLIAKPAKEDGSNGINQNAVVNNLDELRSSVGNLLQRYDQEILVEQYIDGREFAVAILGNNMPSALPPSEICFDELGSVLPHITSYEAKWYEDDSIFQKTPSVCPAIVDSKTQRRLQTVALDIYRLMHGRDYGRVDFRMDKAGNLFVLEYNPNSDISLTAGYVKALKAAGISYDSFVKILLKEAMSRKNHD